MASVVDQMLLSGLNFLIGLVLIRFAAKETYGLYSQLFGLGMLSTTLLESLIGSALTTHATRVSDEERPALLARAFRLQLLAALGFAAVFAIGMQISGHWIEYSEPLGWLALAFAAFIFAQACREYCRTVLFIESRATEVAKMDALFVGVCIVLGAVYLWWGHTSVTGVLWLLTAANVLASVVYGRPIYRAQSQGDQAKPLTHDVGILWSMGRWALIGSVVAWLVNYSYLYFAGLFLGAAALADLNAARLLLIPISILSTAWGRVARPQMGRMITQQQNRQLSRLFWLSTGLMVAFAVAYAASLWTAFPILKSWLFGQKYANVAPMLLAWGGYFAINSARIAGTTLLTSYGVFKALFWQGFVSAVILVGLCLVLIPRYGVYGALMAMTAVEVIEMLTNWLYMIPKARNGGFKSH